MKKKTSKKAVGRPPALGKARSNQMQLRVADGEKARWSKKAKSLGKKLSEWIRETLNRASEEEAPG